MGLVPEGPCRDAGKSTSGRFNIARPNNSQDRGVCHQGAGTTCRPNPFEPKPDGTSRLRP